MINKYIAALAEYAINNNLITEDERSYSINLLLDVLQLDEYIKPSDAEEDEIKTLSQDLEDILKNLLDDAVRRGLIEDSIVYKDILDTKMMNCFTARPAEIIREFYSKFDLSPLEATNYFYQTSKASNYIRTGRVAKDIKWQTDTEYGKLDITINLSKPEKDPKAIAAAKNAKQVSYPKCQLCIENEGYAGRLDHPARSNHRIIPIKICDQDWGLQYSPYVYFNEHCIVLNKKHDPMTICRAAFEKMFDFIKLFPHYMVSSNADLPIVGGSILAHEHFQGGNYEFPMARANSSCKITIAGFEDVDSCILNWPLSVIRIKSKDPKRLIDLSDLILTKWRAYTDEEAFIFAETDGEPHNTISPVARRRGEYYEMDLALRNNITTEDRPLGVYHPRPEYFHIKKENIGIIEVQGLAILPSRLKKELEQIKTCILDAGIVDAKVDAEAEDINIIIDTIRNNPDIEKHADWMENVLSRRGDEINIDTIDDILKEEVGKVFKGVLEDAGVFKNTPAGRKHFLKFINSI